MDRQRVIDVAWVVAVLAMSVDHTARALAAGSPTRWAAAGALALTTGLLLGLARTRHVVATASVGGCLLTTVVVATALRSAPTPAATGLYGLTAHETLAPLVATHLLLLALAARDPERVAFTRLPAPVAGLLSVPVLYGLGGLLAAIARGPRPEGLLGDVAGLPASLQPGAVLLLGVLPLACLALLGLDVVRSIRGRDARPLVRDAGLIASGLLLALTALVVGHARGQVSLERWPAFAEAVGALPVEPWWTGAAEELADETPPTPGAPIAPPPAAAPAPAPAPPPTPAVAPAPAPVAATPVAATPVAARPVAVAEPLPVREARPATEEDLARVDVAAACFGGTIRGPRGVDLFGPEVAPEQLLSRRGDGWAGYGWALPTSFVVTFRGGAAADVDAVVLDTRPRLSFMDVDRFIPANRVVEVALAASERGPDGPFAPLGTFRLPADARHVTLAFAPTTARALEVRIVAHAGDTYVALGKLHVLEVPGGPSVLDGASVDVARIEVGGAVVRHTSQESGAVGAWRLVDDAPGGWISADGALPQDLVVGFPGGATATISAVELEADPAGPATDAPREIEVAVSAVSPLDGFTTVATRSLRPEGGRIALDPPAAARYVRVRIVANHGGARTRIGALRVHEAPHGVNGYRSVVAGVRAGRDVERAEATPEGIATQPDTWEVEDDGSPERASPLPLGITLEGQVSPRGEHDLFSLELPVATPGQAPPRVVTLSAEGAPALRSSVVVRDATGAIVRTFDPGRVTGARASLSWVARDDRYTVDVTEARSSLVLVYDLSGSMKDDVGALERAMRAFVARVEPSEEVALVSFQGDRATVRCPFTADRDALARSLDGAFGVGGHTPLYDALLMATDLLQDRPGNRAIVLFSDGADTTSRASYAELWRRLAARRVRTYAIGLGAELESITPTQGCSGIQALRAIGDATGGRAWHAPTAEELGPAFEQVATELRRTASYRLRATLSTESGRLEVTGRGAALRRLTCLPRVEFLLDASASMGQPLEGWRRDVTSDGRGGVVASFEGRGTTKLDLARGAFERLLERLPDEVDVALRTYGGDASGACGKSALLHPMGPLDRARLRSLVRGLRGRGKTAIAAALAQVPADFAPPEGEPEPEGERVVVMISDGRDTCGGDPVKEVRRLERAGFRVRLHVVAFRVADDEALALSKLAEATGGRLLRADDAQTLDDALVTAVQTPIRVEDDGGEVVARGVAGAGPVALPAGTFRLVIDGQPQVVVEQVTVRAGATTRVELTTDAQQVVGRVVE